MQFTPDFHPDSRRMCYHPSASPVLCSCNKCFQRNYPDYENFHFLQRQELEARERYMLSSHGLPLPSPGSLPATFAGHAGIDARHYYAAASTFPTQLPHFSYDRDAGDYGKINKTSLLHDLYNTR